MRNAARCGNAMRDAMKMDGRGPPDARALSYGSTKTDFYERYGEFVDAIVELGASRGVAKVYAKGGVYARTDTKTGDRVVISSVNGEHKITRAGLQSE